MNPLDAARELRANWSRWQELGRKIAQWDAEARARYQDALSREDDRHAEGALLAWVTVRELEQEYETENRRWRWIASLVPFVAPDSPELVAWEYAPTGNGLLGAVPALWPLGLAAAAAAVTSLALAVRAVFRRATPAERIMEQLKRRDITAAEAERLLNALDSEGFGIGGGLVAVGAALVAAVFLVRSR